MGVNFTAEQVTNALKWLLNSPVLLDNRRHSMLIASPLPMAYQPDITGMLQHINHLLSELQFIRSHLLGIYYETLWQFIFKNLKETRLIHCNRQVQSDKRTVGEFDLIYFCTVRNTFIHREMAVKFYLGLPNARSPREWIGPGINDRLDLKFTRMLEQQCLLSQTVEGKRSLETLGITDIISEVLLQGCLFYPFGKHCDAPDIASNHHLRGEWLPMCELNHYLEHHKISHVAHLTKHEWITETINRRSTDPTHSRVQTKEWLRPSSLLTQHREPVMLSGLKDTAGHPNETHRFFLVPDDWEKQAYLRIQQ